MLAEFDKPNITEERKAELKQQAELIRFIADDILQGKTPKEASERLLQINKNKVEKLMNRCVSDFITGHEKIETTISKLDEITPQLAGINKQTFVAQMQTYATLGEMKIAAELGKMKAKTSAGQKNIDELKAVLGLAWARVATKIEVDLQTTDDLAVRSRYKQIADLPSEHKPLIEAHAMNNDFAELMKLSKDILSIQQRYENKWFGLKAMFNPSERKYQIIKDINSQLHSLLADYQNTDPKSRKNVDEIRNKMCTFLETKKSEMEGNSTLKDQITRVVGVFKATEEKKLNANIKPSILSQPKPPEDMNRVIDLNNFQLL